MFMKRIVISLVLFVLALLAAPAAAQSDTKTLPETFTSDDERLVVHYPTGWYTDTQFDGQVRIGTNEDSIDLGYDSLESGQAGIVIMYGVGGQSNESELLRGTNSLDVLRQLVDMLSSDILELDKPESFTLGDYPAARAVGHIQDNEVFMLVVNYGVDHYSLIMGYAAEGELRRYEPKLLAIAESADYLTPSNM
jgi:hypothetical protein